MKKEIIKTADGSDTILVLDWNEPYHSMNGALNESKYIFLERGYEKIQGKEIKILEMGFGTGLNACLTAQAAPGKKVHTLYHAIEKYPVEQNLIEKLNYGSVIGTEFKRLFNRIHEVEWGKTATINRFFRLKKIQSDFLSFVPDDQYHLVYFDAFAPDLQPELWQESIFRKIFDALSPKGLLVTYSSRGTVRRAMQRVGFRVQKVSGPPGKREIVQAFKP